MRIYGSKKSLLFRLYKKKLDKRIEANDQYSLRSLARSLDIDPSQLSKVLSRKLIPSPKLTKRLLLNLPVEDENKEAFIDSVAEEIKCRAKNTIDASYTDCSDSD